MNGMVYFGTCKRCGRGFCYEDRRIDYEHLILRIYDRKKRLTETEQEDFDERRERIRTYEAEHRACDLCAGRK